MSIGINATNLINITDIQNVVTFTDPVDFFIGVNWDIYGGWLWFLMLLITWVILFMISTYATNPVSADQIGSNLMYTGAIVSVVSIIIRGIYVTRLGVVQGMITDNQMWIFPLITVLCDN